MSARRRYAFLERLRQFYLERQRTTCAAALMERHGKRSADLASTLEQDLVELVVDRGATEAPCEVKESITHGKGVFARKAGCKPGEILGFYPGAAVDADTLRKVGGTQIFSNEMNQAYLYFRITDGKLIDPTKGPSCTDPNPLAMGHFINHPPSPEKLNAMMFEMDLSNGQYFSTTPSLKRRVPNWKASLRSLTPLRFDFEHCLDSVVVVVATKPVEGGEELFVDYNYFEETGNLPEWYCPIPKEGAPKPEDWKNWLSWMWV